MRILDEGTDYTVRPGRIRLSRRPGIAVVDEPNVKVYEFDLSSKYPGDVYGDLPGDGTTAAWISTGDDSIKLDETSWQATGLIFPGEWIVLADGSRYTVRICLYKREES